MSKSTVNNHSVWLDRYFQISARKSTLQIEILAGLSTYLSLAYILVLNPAILSKAGFDYSSVLFATAIASGLTTILMGVWARLPFALAPGLEMNGFVAFSAIGVMGLTVQESLGAVFWSGVLCIILTLLPIRKKIISSLPENLQANLSLSVGVFVATIGLFLSKMVIFKDAIPISLGSFVSTEAIALYIGLLYCLTIKALFKKNIYWQQLLNSTAFLVAIIISTVFLRFNDLQSDATSNIGSSVFQDVGNLNLFSFSNPSFYTVFMVLFLIDFYGSIGKFVGLTATTNLSSKDTGVVGMEKAMYVDGVGTVLGATLGTTSIITYVESAIGIQAGGRTGIVAIICGSLMLISLLFTPLISLVPVVATSGILIYVGYSLIPIASWKEGSFTKIDVIIGLAMGGLSFFTFSLDKAMLFGFGAYVLLQYVNTRKVNMYLLASFLLIFASVLTQYSFK